MTAAGAGLETMNDRDFSSVIDSYPSIGLSELMQLAPLMSRIDRKYLVPTSDLPLLLGGFDGEARALEIDGQRQFRYRSVYFDTPELHSFRSTAHRRRRRFKIRTRSYLDSGLHVLEVKTRGMRGMTTKQRLPYAGAGFTLADEDRAELQQLFGTIEVPADPASLTPTLSTGYRRTTVYLPAGHDRVTIDHGLTWSLIEGPAAALVGHAVVEVKSARTTSSVDRLLWSMGHRPCSLSKYGTGLALLRPELPSTAWTRVLRRHIRPHLEPRLPGHPHHDKDLT